MKNIFLLDGDYDAKYRGKRSPRIQRTVNSLRWRQKFQSSEVYRIELENGTCLELKQLKNGEINGIGTGANVWPAAHILSKYFEKLYMNRTTQMPRVCDIGTGTGCVGLIAACMGSTVVLTDQINVLSLAKENLDVCVCKGLIERDLVEVMPLEWGEGSENINPPFDVILVSDCILPKLYPMEPLVKVRVNLSYFMDRLKCTETNGDDSFPYG